MFVGLPGKTAGTLTGPARKGWSSELQYDLGGEPVELFAPYAGQTADVLLTAIDAGAERASVIEALFETQVEDGIIGSFEITRTGDPSVSTIDPRRRGALQAGRADHTPARPDRRRAR